MKALTRRTLLGSAAAVTAGSLIAPATRATAPATGKQAPGFYRYKIGDFEVTSFNDGFVKVPKLELLRGQSAARSQSRRWSRNPSSRRMTCASPLIRSSSTPARSLCCSTPASVTTARRRRGSCLANMSAAGVDPKAVDVVIISHFHPDHISGIRQKDGAANFPNAEIMVPAGEWTYWNDSSEIDKTLPAWKGAFANVKRVFDPIAKNVKQFEFGKELVPGITSVDARGHSPGHAAFIISSGNAKLMYIADVTNHPAIFARNPEYRLWADMIPDQALTTRRKLLDMLAAERMPMTGYHYPFPAVGYIARLGNGYDFRPASWQSVL